MRKLLVGLLLALLAMLMLAPAALAANVQSGPRFTVGPGETVDDDLIYSGVSLIIDGTVKGDVIAFAESVTVNGTVEGNLVSFSATIDVKGRVTGTVFGGAKALFVTGNVDGSLVTFGGSQRVDQGASIGRNWIAMGEEIRTEGRIGRGLLVGAGNLTIDGPVARDVRAYVNELHIGSNARIDGTVEYHSDRQASVAPGARTGELIFRPEEYNLDDSLFGAMWLAISFGGFLAVGLILLSLFPQLRFHFAQAVVEKPWQAPLAGLLILLVTPLAAILLMITLIGLPLGALSLLIYPLAIYLGQVLLSWTAGRLIADRWAWLGRQNWALIFLAGTIVTTVLVELPIVGSTLGFLAVIYGLGGLCFAYTRSRHGGPTQIAG